MGSYTDPTMVFKVQDSPLRFSQVRKVGAGILNSAPQPQEGPPSLAISILLPDGRNTDVTDAINVNTPNSLD